MKYSISNEEKEQSSRKPSADRDKTPSFVSYEPLWTLNEIVLRPAIKESLEDAISFCQNRDKIIKEWNLGRFLKGTGGCLGINLYGDPGTGKSIAAEAIAKAINRSIIRAKLSELLDSLHGQTEKNLSAMFELAEKENLIILFDEADSLLSRRSSASSANSETNNMMKSHMLNLLDRGSAIVIFTTNFFKNYDRAFIRRILFNIGFPNPNKEELKSLWTFHLTEMIPKRISYEELATLSEGLTGGDIKKLTLSLCIKLSSKRISSIDLQTVQDEIARYKDAIKASNQVSEGQVISEGQVSGNVRKALDEQNKTNNQQQENNKQC